MAGKPIHGMSQTPTYYSWNSMRKRCRAPNKQEARYYHGIKVCQRWHKFENFLSDMGVRPIGTSLDRIDSKKGYFPENCRWATEIQQKQNRKSVIYVSWENGKIPLYQLAIKFGINPLKARRRWHRGLSLNEVLSTDYRK